MSLVVKLSCEKLLEKLVLLPLSGLGLIAKKAKRNPKISKQIPIKRVKVINIEW